MLKQKCPYCQNGWVNETERLPCGSCFGSGIYNGNKCLYCKGSGVYTRQVRRFCSNCRGTGKI